jgi:hypothetical protein
MQPFVHSFIYVSICHLFSILFRLFSCLGKASNLQLRHWFVELQAADNVGLRGFVGRGLSIEASADAGLLFALVHVALVLHAQQPLAVAQHLLPWNSASRKSSVRLGSGYGKIPTLGSVWHHDFYKTSKGAVSLKS